MKRMIFSILMSFILCNAIVAQTKTKVKADSEIIREFKNNIKKNEFADFQEKADALKPIKMEALKSHNIYKDLIDIVKNEKKDGLIREFSIELLLYFKANGQEVLGLESTLIELLQSEKTGWYIRKVIISQVISAIKEDDIINMNKLKAALNTVLNQKVKDPDVLHTADLKRSIFAVLEESGISYAAVKSLIESEMKNSKSDLKSAILLFLENYSNSHEDFIDPEIKRYCQSIFRSENNEYTPEDIASAIRLYGSILANEKSSKIQNSDEELLIKFLKNENVEITIAAAKALHLIKSTSSVEKIVERLQEMMGNIEARDALIDALVYMEHSLIYSETESPSRKKKALTLIRDKFMIALSHTDVVTGNLQKKLLNAMDYFGIERDASEYINLATIKSFANLISSVKEDEVKLRIAKILTNYTGKDFGPNTERWLQFVKDEEKKPNSRWLRVDAQN